MSGDVSSGVGDERREFMVAWREKDGFEFEAGALTGRLHAKRNVHLHLAGQAGTVAGRLLELDRLSYCDDQGICRETVPVADGPYIQGNACVVPLSFNSQVGLAGTLRVLAESDGLMAEIRVQTIAPVRDLSLVIANTWRTTMTFPRSRTRDLSHRWGRGECGISVICREGTPVLAVFSDVGEGGTAERVAVANDSSAGRVAYSFFRQSLEKGVILVGRIAFFSWRPACDESMLEELHRQWLERDTFL